jgi:uncharacterized protein (TIGR02996 family)
VNEEDAFLRTIAASPRDEVLRLVYADWLEDRGDPRAAYVRGEVKWAEPWLHFDRPEEPTELQRQARGLDPLWVARVSRPPLGVCCDHLRIIACEGQVEPSDIDALESTLQVSLPVEYRAFLLNYNGGEIPTDWDIGDNDVSDGYVVGNTFYYRHFYPVIARPLPNRNRVVTRQITVAEGGLLRIGLNPNRRDRIMLSLRKYDLGTVHHVDFRVGFRVGFPESGTVESVESLATYFALIGSIDTKCRYGY